MSVNSKMTAIANKIRTLLGLTGAMGLDSMASNIGKAQEEVDSQAVLIEQLRTILAGKAGGIVPTGTVTPTENGIHDVTQYASAVVNVNSLPAGVTALSTGTVQIELSEGAAAEIPHGLSVRPNFYVLFAAPGIDADAQTNMVINATAAEQYVTAEGETFQAVYNALRINKNGYFVMDTDQGVLTKFFTASAIKIYGPLNSDTEYIWIAGHHENLVNS